MTASAGAWALEAPPPVVRCTPLRLLVSAGLVGLAVLLVVGHQDVRNLEAAVARVPISLLLGHAVHVSGTDLVFYPDHDGPGLRALKITFSCSSVPIAAPLALLGGAMAVARRLPLLRVVAGIAVAVALVVVVNLVRIVVIAFATSRFGLDGYEVSHRVIGSAVTVIGACLAFIVTYRFVAGSRRTRRRR